MFLSQRITTKHDTATTILHLREGLSNFEQTLSHSAFKSRVEWLTVGFLVTCVIHSVNHQTLCEPFWTISIQFCWPQVDSNQNVDTPLGKWKQPGCSSSQFGVPRLAINILQVSDVKYFYFIFNNISHSKLKSAYYNTNYHEGGGPTPTRR